MIIRTKAELAAHLTTLNLHDVDIGMLASWCQAFGQSGRGTKDELVTRLTRVCSEPLEPKSRLMIEDDPYTWTIEKLRRKCNQAWDLAGCARRDGDTADERRWTDLARRYAAILTEVRGALGYGTRRR